MFIDLLKAALYGVVQGITEWLPVSSTGHMLLLEDYIAPGVSGNFMEMFRVLIQLGSILAVVVLYFTRLVPFMPSATKPERRSRWLLWAKILVACVPAGVLGVLFDDWFDEHFYNSITVAAALILYGAAFIIIELWRKKRPPVREAATAEAITFREAFIVGCFQVLSLVPGTSRSGSTVIGGMLCGMSRPAAAEFSFFLAIPVMFGASLVKLVKFGFDFTGAEIAVLLCGMVVAFAVSCAAIRFLVGFVKKHSFSSFGWYRIALGALVLLKFALAR